MFLVVVLMLSGCAHCSTTVSHFDGKTFGINPYGSGNLKVDRITSWGSSNCVFNGGEIK